MGKIFILQSVDVESERKTCLLGLEAAWNGTFIFKGRRGFLFLPSFVPLESCVAWGLHRRIGFPVNTHLQGSEPLFGH